MEESVLPGIYLLLVGGFIGFIGYVVKDWLKSGRTEKGIYMTRDEFKQHKRECCILDLKKAFNQCQQESCTVQADHESRLKSAEDRLKDGHETFKALSDKMDTRFDFWGEKFDRLIQSVIEIQVTLKIALDREKRENGL